MTLAYLSISLARVAEVVGGGRSEENRGLPVDKHVEQWPGGCSQPVNTTGGICEPSLWLHG